MLKGIPKKCGCGLVYKTEAEWLALPFSFLWFDSVVTLEARNCTCRSTISVTVGHGNIVNARRAELGLVGDSFTVQQDGNVVKRIM